MVSKSPAGLGLEFPRFCAGLSAKVLSAGIYGSLVESALWRVSIWMGDQGNRDGGIDKAALGSPSWPMQTGPVHPSWRASWRVASTVELPAETKIRGSLPVCPHEASPAAIPPKAPPSPPRFIPRLYPPFWFDWTPLNRRHHLTSTWYVSLLRVRQPFFASANYLRVTAHASARSRDPAPHSGVLA